MSAKIAGPALDNWLEALGIETPCPDTIIIDLPCDREFRIYRTTEGGLPTDITRSVLPRREFNPENIEIMVQFLDAIGIGRAANLVTIVIPPDDVVLIFTRWIGKADMIDTELPDEIKNAPVIKLE